MFTRLMCVRGDPKNLEIMRMVVANDHNIVGLDETLIITPRTDLLYGIIPNATIVDDSTIQDKYPALQRLIDICPHWRWYYQQCLKLCSMDMLDRQRFLIHDSDCYFTIPYDPFCDGKLNFVSKRGKSWHDKPYARGQQDVYEYLCHRSPSIQENCTTEICPYSKDAWIALKNRLEHLHAKHWLDAIIDSIDKRWPIYYGLWEYYILINHAVYEGHAYHVLPMSWINAEHGKDMDLQGYDRVTYLNTIYEII